MNSYVYVKANPTNNIDPTGLLGSAGVDAVKKAKKECGKDDDCPMPVQITNRGICDGQGPECASSMRAAGIPGPYYTNTSTYSGQCLLTFGLGFKATSAVAGTVIVDKAPGFLAARGMTGAAAAAGEAAAVLNNPVTIGASALVGVASIFEHCKCNR